MTNDYEMLICDVLVIGGGMAGLSAAIRAKDFSDNVILVDKAKVARSGGSIHAHAYGSPAPEGGFGKRLKEMVQRSAYLGDQAWFEILLREIGARLNDMQNWGVQFLTDDKGDLKSDAIRGQSKGFVYLGYGRQVIETIAGEALKRGVRFVERIAVTDLLTSDGQVPTHGYITGAVGMHTRTGKFVVFKAKAVVIATGLAGSKMHVISMDNLTGDGYAMAFRAGAEITGLEFGPQGFGIWSGKFGGSGPGQFQHGGAKLINRKGEEFLFKYEGASREFVGFAGHFDQSAICRAIIIENIEGRGPCYFDCRGWSEEKFNNIYKALPLTMRAFSEPGVGVDLKKEPVQTDPMVYAYGLSCQTGIRINTIGGTSVNGLFAAGAAAYYGGGPGPQSLCLVGGYRAGENAAKWAQEMEPVEGAISQIELFRENLYKPLKRRKGVSPDQVYHAVNKLVTPWGASFFKHEKRLTATLDKINEISKEDLPRITASDTHELIKAFEAKNYVLLMGLYNRAALERKESRLFHFREDFPYTDHRNWLKWILLKSDHKGTAQVILEPVPLGCSAIVPDSFSKIPAAAVYQFEK